MLGLDERQAATTPSSRVTPKWFLSFIEPRLAVTFIRTHRSPKETPS